MLRKGRLLPWLGHALCRLGGRLLVVADPPGRPTSFGNPNGCLLCDSQDAFNGVMRLWYCRCCYEAKEQVYREYEATGKASDAMRRHLRDVHKTDETVAQRKRP